MRTRTRVMEQATPIEATMRCFTKQPSGPWTEMPAGTWSTTSTGVSSSSSELCEDVVTRHYKKLMRSGVILNNPLRSHKTYIVEPGPVNFSHHTVSNGGSGDQGVTWDGPYIPFSYVQSRPEILGWQASFMEAKMSCINQAVTAAHAGINPEDLLALATLAESRKTVEFLSQSLSRVHKIARNVRRANFRALRREISRTELRDRYMEARYAVRPLIYDVNGVVKAYHDIRSPITRKSVGMRSDSASESGRIINVPLFYETVCDLDQHASYECSARAGVLYTVNRRLVHTLGLTKLAETAWELLPFSFIVDWFANVGQTIGAHSPKLGVTELASWVTVKQIYQSYNTLAETRSTAAQNIFNVENFSTCGNFMYGRRELVLERFVQPPLSTFPEIDIHLDKYKLLDLGIILSGIAKDI